MTGREAAARWTHVRAKFRKRTSHLTPKVITTYPFEIVSLAIALLMGVPILLGLSQSPILVKLVGPIALYAWAAGLAIGGVTVAVALRKLHAMGLASGLQLLSGCFLVYALVIVLAAGPQRAWTASAAYIILGVISMARASYFRRVIDIQIGARRIRDGE